MKRIPPRGAGYRPQPRTAQTLPLAVGPERREVTVRVARRLQWACARFPLSVVADDEKALALAELILRDIEGRDD